MNEWAGMICTGFAGDQMIASGVLADVVVAVKRVLDADPKAAILIFDDTTAGLVEVDLRGRAEDVVARLATEDPTLAEPAPAPVGPGRPRLGVIAREVTLLPCHWDWLSSQPGGASVALRKLVEEARRANAPRDAARKAREVAYRFMSALAGDRPGYEDATRALFAGDRARFYGLTEPWPVGVREHARKLAMPAFVVGE